jgi:flagellar biosynthesis protein FlhG
MGGTTRRARTIAITSGKGGVGKTCLTANLGWALVKAGRRVLVLDADLGLANLDILLNLNPIATLHDVIAGTHRLEEVILEGPGGLLVLPAGSGMADYSRLTSGLRERLPEVIERLSQDHDYLLLDSGAGISDVVLYIASLAQEVLMVATPEPTSLADAYATIKVMALQQERTVFSLVMNQVPKERDGQALVDQLQQVANRFIRDALGRSVSLAYLGAIPADPAVERSVCKRQLLAASHPESPAAQAVLTVAACLETSAPSQSGRRRLPSCSITNGAPGCRLI